jgi:hypothetical protein
MWGDPNSIARYLRNFKLTEDNAIEPYCLTPT